MNKTNYWKNCQGHLNLSSTSQLTSQLKMFSTIQTGKRILHYKHVFGIAHGFGIGQKTFSFKDILFRPRKSYKMSTSRKFRALLCPQNSGIPDNESDIFVLNLGQAR